VCKYALSAYLFVEAIQKSLSSWCKRITSAVNLPEMVPRTGDGGYERGMPLNLTVLITLGGTCFKMSTFQSQAYHVPHLFSRP